MEMPFGGEGLGLTIYFGSTAELFVCWICMLVLSKASSFIFNRSNSIRPHSVPIGEHAISTFFILESLRAFLGLNAVVIVGVNSGFKACFASKLILQDLTGG